MVIPRCNQIRGRRRSTKQHETTRKSLWFSVVSCGFVDYLFLSFHCILVLHLQTTHLKTKKKLTVFFSSQLQNGFSHPTVCAVERLTVGRACAHGQFCAAVQFKVVATLNIDGACAAVCAYYCA